jgi:acyl-CoA reductase-like NAD-dependent aldehyde dehydrogenase
MKDRWPLFIANTPEQPNADLGVADKYTGKVIARVALANPAIVDQAIAAADAAAQPMRQMRAYERQAILYYCVDRLTERRPELAVSLCAEAGKPLSDAQGEVGRLIDTFRYAAEEAVRVGGEIIDLEISKRAAGRRGWCRRVPIGPCAFISPFNFPLNLAAHKIAPALAVGCPFVLKPASRTPLGALMLGEVLAE